MSARKALDRCPEATQAVPMFTATCTSCGTRSLFSNGAITAVATGPQGHLVRFRCYCGADAALGPTGRRAPVPEPPM